MLIKIIGAGFPRTGTTTLKKALETLGYNKTYHFKDLIANPKKLKYWQELENKGLTNFDALFDGFQATVDFPGYPYYKILLKKYPNAKVLKIAIVATSLHSIVEEPVSPCGGCRQVMIEYEKLQKKNIEVILKCDSSKVIIFSSVADLLPLSFDSSVLKKQ